MLSPNSKITRITTVTWWSGLGLLCLTLFPDYVSGSLLINTQDNSVLSSSMTESILLREEEETYEQETYSWKQIGEDIKPTANHGDGCGLSVDVSSNGERVIVACPYSDGKSGSVYLYQLTNKNKWKQIASLTGTDHHHYLGSSVSIATEESNICAVGEIGYEKKKGRVQILQYSENKKEFKQTDEGEIKGENEGDEFGDPIDLSGDGSRIAVGSLHGENVDIWDYHDEKEKWKRTTQIPSQSKGLWDVSLSGKGKKVALGFEVLRPNKHAKAKLIDIKNDSNLMEIDNFGPVSLSDNGKFLAVASYFAECTSFNCTGSIKVFQKDMKQVGSVIEGVDGDQCGAALDLAADGKTVAIGCHNKVLVATLNTDGKWTWDTTSIPLDFEVFAYEVAISSDGGTIALGAPNQNLIRIFHRTLLSPSKPSPNSPPSPSKPSPNSPPSPSKPSPNSPPSPSKPSPNSPSESKKKSKSPSKSKDKSKSQPPTVPELPIPSPVTSGSQSQLITSFSIYITIALLLSFD